MMLRIWARPLRPLRAGGVVDHVLGDEVVEDKTLARLLATSSSSTTSRALVGAENRDTASDRLVRSQPTSQSPSIARAA